MFFFRKIGEKVEKSYIFMTKRGHIPFSDTLRAPSPEDDVAEHPPSKPVEMQSASSYRASVDNARSRIAEQVRADRARYRAQQGKADSWDVDAAVPRDMSAVPAPRMEDPAGLRAAAARMAAEAQAEVDEETQPVGGRLLHAQRVARAQRHGRERLGAALRSGADVFAPRGTAHAPLSPYSCLHAQTGELLCAGASSYGRPAGARF